MTDNFENGCLIQVVFNLIQWRNGCIFHTIAVDTPNVIVLVRIVIVSLQRTAELEFLYLTQL